MKYSIQQKSFTEKSTKPDTDMINILMVDDLKENLVALEAVLTSPRYHLVTATSGEEALRCILKQDFAVILLDVQMPGLNGFDTAKLIKARKKSKNIPIIFITAISQDMEHVLHGYSVGAIDYIFKPFNPETLRQKVEQFVKIYQSHAESLKQTEWKKTIELEEVQLKLNRTTVDLDKNETLSKVIGETLLDTIVTFDEAGVILSVNPIVRKMFGYFTEELIGKHLATLIPVVKQDGERMDSLSIPVLTTFAIGKILEGVALRQDQNRFPVDIQIGKATIEDHPIFVCTIRDVTERKEIERIKNQQFHLLKKVVEERTLDLLSTNEKLKEEISERKKVADNLFVSHERFKKIFEASPCLMAIRSLRDQRFIDVNSTWLDFTGYEYEEVKDQVFDWALFTNMDENKVDLAALETNDPLSNLKVTYQAKNGELRSGLLSTEIIEIQDEACVLILVNDITDREHLEKEMFRLDRLNLIGEMAAGIAHEIRNPMTTVYGFLQMWKNTNERLSPEYIDLMLDELNRANSIIKEFLTLAKNKASNKTRQSLNRIIETILPLINAEANLAGKRVQHQLVPCPDLLLDEKEIRQLFLNLVLNGLEAMDFGGILTVRTYCEDDQVILEVKDGGKGITADILDKMGTPFFTTKDQGTGLGLAVCYSIADRHQAKINVESGNEGTCFSVCFPRSPDKQSLQGEYQ
ncbi:PAS domain S-box protein [Neobacillus drentensis]|uniref:PAS domain S-box protein n=1 Tax=Neobacillus drentensis TaxID=220684 RepID=UPI001F1E525B|nr:PAS domain S-box protein [Neobacillus drentensis]ULT54413.1 PAS domain S-box protein [Neobacillus drentensis]